jgi:WD40 repeat protein
MQHLQAKQKNSVVRVRFAPEKPALYGLMARPRRLSCWDLTTGDCDEVSYSSQGAAELEFSRTGEWHIQGCSDGVAYINRTKNDQFGIPLVVHQTRWQAQQQTPPQVAFSPHETRRWAGAAGRELWLWNQVTLEYVIAPEEGNYSGLAFHPNGEQIYFAEESVGVVCARIKPFHVWEVVHHWPNEPQEVRLTISSDGEMLAIAEKGVLRFLGLTSGSRRELRLRGEPNDIQFQPGTHLLGVATRTDTVTLVDADTASVAKQFQWNIGQVHSVAFSWDGTLAAAGGTLGRLVVWDAM